jgi:hypothetical protein
MQKTGKLSSLCNEGSNSEWFVQFPRMKSDCHKPTQWVPACGNFDQIYWQCKFPSVGPDVAMLKFPHWKGCAAEKKHGDFSFPRLAHHLFGWGGRHTGFLLGLTSTDIAFGTNNQRTTELSLLEREIERDGLGSTPAWHAILWPRTSRKYQQYRSC